MSLEKLLHLNNIPAEEIYYDMGVYGENLMFYSGLIFEINNFKEIKKKVNLNLKFL